MARKTTRNVIVTDENWEKVNEENKELLEEFKEYLHSLDKSPLTIINYDSDIRICFVWSLLYIKNKFFVDFTKRDIIKYQNYLLNTLNLSSNRIRRLKASISSMSNFIETILDEDYPDYRNIVNKIPSPDRDMSREKTILSDEEVKRLLDILIEEKQYQQALSVALAWASGSRKSELLRFKVSYFKDEYIVYGSLYKTPEKIKTKGRTSKGKLLYRYSLVSKVKPYFELWMQERERLGIPVEEDTLFLTKQSGEWKPMKISTLSCWTKKFSNILGVDFYFHALRHTFTTTLSANNIPATIIKELQGWSNISLVDIYDDNTIDDKLGQYFDENGIKQVESKTLGDL